MSAKRQLWVSRPTFPDIIEPLSEHFDVHVHPVDAPLPHEDLVNRLMHHDAVIVGMKEHIGAVEVADARALRVVANLSVGYDNLDVDALTAAGIVASNTAGSLNESVADFAWALMLGAARRVGVADRFVRDGHWNAPVPFLNWLGTDLSGGTLGILGMGRIGQAVARRAVGFGMPVIYHNRSRLDAATERDCRAEYVDFDTLLARSDALVVVVPLTPETRHILGADELAKMKPEAVLVSVARGGVIDEKALVEALSTGKLAAAGLDVFEGEPHVFEPLRQLDNVLLSPHIASASVRARRAMTAKAVDNVLAVFGLGPHAGNPPDVLNPAVLDKR